MIKKTVIILCMGILAAVPGAARDWQAPDQEQARQRAGETVPFVREYRDDCSISRRICLIEEGISLDDVTQVYYLLDSPIIKAREDHYQPVRFAHKRHAALTRDCSKCHHYRPKDPDALETTRCSACHQDSFNPDRPERIGLKAAYHGQCLECHRQEARGPVDCNGCHLSHVPDHKDLVELPDNPDPFQVTAECLRCHETQGEDMLKTAHWLWRGPSPYTTGHRKDILHGKGTTALNNY